MNYCAHDLISLLHGLIRKSLHAGSGIVLASQDQRKDLNCRLKFKSMPYLPLHPKSQKSASACAAQAGLWGVLMNSLPVGPIRKTKLKDDSGKAALNAKSFLMMHSLLPVWPISILILFEQDWQLCLKTMSVHGFPGFFWTSTVNFKSEQGVSTHYAFQTRQGVHGL
jgi:hypothetical protein